MFLEMGMSIFPVSFVLISGLFTVAMVKTEYPFKYQGCYLWDCCFSWLPLTGYFDQWSALLSNTRILHIMVNYIIILYLIDKFGQCFLMTRQVSFDSFYPLVLTSSTIVTRLKYVEYQISLKIVQQ